MASRKLVIVGGSLATGKSTISKFLSGATGFRRISMDEIKEALFDVGGYKDRAWSKEIGRLSFPVFCDLIDLHLSRGESVIADATFMWVSDADWLHELTARHGVELLQVWLTTDPQVARERFVSRARTSRHPGHNDALDSVMEEFDQRFFSKSDHAPLTIRGKTKIVDTTDFDSIDHDSILKFISS